MFTGIIDHCGKIVAVTRTGDRTTLSIQNNFTDLQLGESIAVDGVCLTVTQAKNNIFSCDLSAETLKVTVAGHYAVGDFINLERALKLTDRIGGHFVTGHVDQTVTVESREHQGEFIVIHFNLPSSHMNLHLIPKGSICINGVSLTLNTINPLGFSVTLIPHTLEKTGLKTLVAGTVVNVEFDLITKIIVQHAKTVFKSLQQITDENTVH